MDKILDELNFGHLKEVFEENKVGPSEVLSLSDGDFSALGISEIGPKAILRHRCQLLVDEDDDSPVLKTLKMFQKRRKCGPDTDVFACPQSDEVASPSVIQNLNETEHDQEQEINTCQDSSDEFEATDTPPITFRRSRSRALLGRLRLQRRGCTSENTEGNSDVISESNTDAIVENNTDVNTESNTEANSEGNTDVIAENRTPETEIIDVAGSSHMYDGPQKLNLKDILSWWTKKTLSDYEETVLFVVQRGNILRSTLRILKRDSFSYCSPFSVHFSGEDGEDYGGPKREFLRLLMSEIKEEYFQGGDGTKFFRHDLEKIANKNYGTAGSLVSFSLLHGGPGLPVMHESLYKLITNGDCEFETLPTIDECVFDYELCMKLKAIEQATDEVTYTAALAGISDWAADQGLSLLNKHFEGRDTLMKLLIRNEIYYRVHSEIDQFQTGLNKVGFLLEAMRMAPSEFQCLFTKSETKLTFSHLQTIYKVEYSPQGSNDRIKENNAIYCLEAFLADCEGGASGVSLEEVLSFWTGASSLPPLGFSKNLEVSFGTDKRLPSAHTCSLVLNIWRGFTDPDTFAADMEKAIRWCGGFHLA